ncbi:MAG: hypothetical protein D6725_04195 [Planctomycetota bacterium]|nr:MAG: hypothetical protein D6725_04195 [Planctomycetota bacterium]
MSDVSVMGACESADYSGDRSAVPRASKGLSRREWRRKRWHVLPGCLAFVVRWIPHDRPVALLFNIVATAIAVGWALWARTRFQKIRRSGETDAAANSVVFGYAAFVLLSLWVFPSNPELAMATLATLAWGDAAAAVVGMNLGVRSWPWNPRTTILGTLGFIGAALVTAVTAYHCESALPASWWQSVQVVAPGVFAAAAVESLPWKFDDNLPTALTAWIVLAVVHGGVVGF